MNSPRGNCQVGATVHPDTCPAVVRESERLRSEKPAGLPGWGLLTAPDFGVSAGLAMATIAKNSSCSRAVHGLQQR